MAILQSAPAQLVKLGPAQPAKLGRAENEPDGLGRRPGTRDTWNWLP